MCSRNFLRVLKYFISGTDTAVFNTGRDSSVDITTGRSGDRIPVGARFFPPLQTGPGAHPAPCTMSTGSLTGIKRLGGGVDQPPPSQAEVEGRVELYLYSPSGLSWLVIGWTLPLFSTFLTYCHDIPSWHRRMYAFTSSPIISKSPILYIFSFTSRTNK